MLDPTLWPLNDHTRAKHKVLRAYLDAWIPIMGQQDTKSARFRGEQPRLLLVDGFAGPGRYQGGESGSPLIMLDALATHKSLSKLEAVQFSFLFIEKDPRRVKHLRDEVAKVEMPSNAHVHIVEDDFESGFGEIVDEVAGRNHTLVPTFAFIDPFGYSAASMSLAGRFLDFARSEALFFLPLSPIARFVGRAGQESALTALFDTDRWREAIPLNGDDRRRFLLLLFEEQLKQQGQVKHVQSFALTTRDGNDYRLVFATGHPRGLEVMKRAMWSVDPELGTRYTALTHSGQTILFQPSVDTGPLLVELQNAFGHAWFTVAQAEMVTRSTLFLTEGHLKRLTLRPAEQAGQLEVQRPNGRRVGTFTNDVRMRFR